MPLRHPKNAHHKRRRPGWFRPVPLRARADGWSEARQCGFLCALYALGSVSAAARAVGMTRMSAYRLRGRKGAESFAAAWDRVLTPPGEGRLKAWRPDYRKVTLQALSEWLERDFVKPVIYRGAMCGIQRKPDNHTLFRLLLRLGERVDPLGPEPAHMSPAKFCKTPRSVVHGPDLPPSGQGGMTPLSPRLCCTCEGRLE